MHPHRRAEGPHPRHRRRGRQRQGLPDVIVPEAQQIPGRDLPEDTLIYLLGSRYCDTDRLSATAWNLFGQTPEGWDRVQAICDYVHRHITFDYQLADNTRTALDAFNGRVGVCRDFTHLAVAFCRCMNIPTRYCTGYLGDIGIPPPYGPMDFAAWFEVYLGGQWHTFDARNNITADRPGADRPWPRRRRRRAQQCVRPRGPDELQGMDRRGARREQLGAAHTVADGRLTDEFGCPTTGSTIPLTHACRGVASVAGSAVCKTHRKPPPRPVSSTAVVRTPDRRFELTWLRPFWSPAARVSLPATPSARLLDDGYRVRATLRSLSREPEVRATLKVPDDAPLEFAAADLTEDAGWPAR